jgi:hypothetical protein
MDPESFLDIANQVIKLKMFPYFDIAHSLLSALAVKEDLGPGAHAFSRYFSLAINNFRIVNALTLTHTENTRWLAG